MASRFVRFNLVGILGFSLQLGVLLTLESMGVPIAIATAIAVETALLHNFAWHERWTWAGIAGGTRAGRLRRFHVSNGLISLVGNAAFTTALTNVGVPTIAANLTAVLACALLNYVSAHLWVISHPTAQRTRGGGPGCAKTWPTFHGHVH
jgi:putative flippase GtrA